MSPSSPIPGDPADQARLENALDVLRKWKRDAIRGYNTTTNDAMRAVYRQRADDAEYLAFRLEALLHPSQSGEEEDQ